MLLLCRASAKVHRSRGTIVHRHHDHTNNEVLYTTEMTIPPHQCSRPTPTTIYMSTDSCARRPRHLTCTNSGVQWLCPLQPRIKCIQLRSARTNRPPWLPPHDANTRALPTALCGDSSCSYAKAGTSVNVAMMRDYVRCLLRSVPCRAVPIGYARERDIY
jgi:hypothetical protein